ncbi:MAG: DoxX family protein [Acidobacteria bacterium]|nr:DoxX family protein [Acidobacteriota bacterium]
MFQKLIHTENSYSTLILRVVLGIVIFPHGAQKALGWFGGGGLSGTMQFFAQMQIPAVFGALDIIAEFLGALGLIVGLLGRVAAFGIGCVMVVAVYRVHLPNGFFMNWSGQQPGEGVEYHLLVLAIVIALLLKGSGALSLDRVLMRRK